MCMDYAGFGVNFHAISDLGSDNIFTKHSGSLFKTSLSNTFKKPRVHKDDP
jgi:hypothetical protein